MSAELAEGAFAGRLGAVAAPGLEADLSKLEDPALRPAFDALLAAGEMIAARERVVDGNPVVDRVLDALVDLATHYEDCSGFELRRACFELLGRSRSFRTAMRLLDFAVWCQRVPDLGYPIDDARVSAVYEATSAVVAIARTHGDAIESRMIERLDPCRRGERNVLAGLMGSFGTRRSLETLAGYVRGADFRFEGEWELDAFWSSVFRLVERHGFAPDMIATLNGALSERFGDANVMVGYHRSLRELADRIGREEGRGLFEILEPGGTQFWDYWLVYQSL